MGVGLRKLKRRCSTVDGFREMWVEFPDASHGGELEATRLNLNRLGTPTRKEHSYICIYGVESGNPRELPGRSKMSATAGAGIRMRANAPKTARQSLFHALDSTRLAILKTADITPEVKQKMMGEASILRVRPVRLPSLRTRKAERPSFGTVGGLFGSQQISAESGVVRVPKLGLSSTSLPLFDSSDEYLAR